MTNAAAASEAVPTAAVTRAAAASARQQRQRRRRAAADGSRRAFAAVTTSHYRCRRRYRHRHCCHGHRHLRCRRHLKRRYRRRTARSLWPCVGCMQNACRVRCGMPLPVPRVDGQSECIQFILTILIRCLIQHSTIGGPSCKLACDVRPLSSPRTRLARRVACRIPVARQRARATWAYA